MRTAYQWSSEHPFQAKSVEQIPAALRQAALSALPLGETLPGGTPPGIFVLPEHMVSKNPNGIGGMKRLPDQVLIFDAHGLLHARLDKPGGETALVSSLRGDALDYAKIDLVLLYGRLELRRLDGSPPILVEYNAVIHEMLQPALQDFLRRSWAPEIPVQPDDADTPALLAELSRQSFKFGNGLRLYALPDGELLHGYVLQPRLSKTYLGVYRRAVLPGSLFTVCGHELVLIQEGLVGAGVHGYFFSRCPAQNVRSVQVVDGEVRVQMQTGEVVLKMEAEKAEACAALWEQAALGEQAAQGEPR